MVELLKTFCVGTQIHIIYRFWHPQPRGNAASQHAATLLASYRAFKQRAARSFICRFCAQAQYACKTPEEKIRAHWPFYPSCTTMLYTKNMGQRMSQRICFTNSLHKNVPSPCLQRKLWGVVWAPCSFPLPLGSYFSINSFVDKAKKVSDENSTCSGRCHNKYSQSPFLGEEHALNTSASIENITWSYAALTAAYSSWAGWNVIPFGQAICGAAIQAMTPIIMRPTHCVTSPKIIKRPDCWWGVQPMPWHPAYGSYSRSVCTASDAMDNKEADFYAPPEPADSVIFDKRTIYARGSSSTPLSLVRAIKIWLAILDALLQGTHPKPKGIKHSNSLLNFTTPKVNCITKKSALWTMFYKPCRKAS